MDVVDAWPRRHKKRVRAVQAIKAKPEYQAVAAVRAQGAVPNSAPRTPDPNDNTVSKRSWEAQVTTWRRGLRGYSNQGAEATTPTWQGEH